MSGMFPNGSEYDGEEEMGENGTDIPGNFTQPQQDDYIFDRTDVRVIFITLYSIVFSFCFFGNLLVILVVTMSRRLRSITNFFLANLAVADLCVGIFCVFPSLSVYLINSWVLGDTMCKVYWFVHTLSYTASIFILVVICIERYFAIIHPIRCRQILTSTKLGLVMTCVWLTSALYSSPRFLFVGTITNRLDNGEDETICIAKRKMYNSEVMDMINFSLLYVTPICVMTALYSRIAVGLWHSNRDLARNASVHVCSNSNSKQSKVKFDSQTSDSQVDVTVGHKTRRFSRKGNNNNTTTRDTHRISSSQNVLRARRGVIRMLIVVVLTFALCNLPYHARKMWQYWSPSYQAVSTFSALFTPLTFLVTFANSAVNPLLYAFMSRNFRTGMLELIGCSLRGGGRNGRGQRQGHSSVGRGSAKSTKVTMSMTSTPSIST